MKKFLPLIPILVFVFLPSDAFPQQVSRFLSLADTENLLKAGVTPKRLVTLIEERGINFELTEEIRQKLTSAGADENVMRVLERAAAAWETAVREEEGRREREAQKEQERQMLAQLKQAARQRFLGTWSPEKNRFFKIEINDGGLNGEKLMVGRYTIHSGRRIFPREDIGVITDDGRRLTVQFRITEGLVGRRYPGLSGVVNPEYDVSETFELRSDGRINHRRRLLDTRDGSIINEEAVLVRE